jgi:hypothetical protein
MSNKMITPSIIPVIFNAFFNLLCLDHTILQTLFIVYK